MNQVIKVQENEQGEQQVSARELHKELGVKTRFSLWVEQNFKMFVKGVDFTSVVTTTVVNNGATRQIDDFNLTTDMAKNVAMMSKTTKSQEIRDYFIAVEKEWNSPELMMARSLNYANDRLIAYQKQHEIDMPKVEAFEHFIATGGAIGLRETAKEMQVKQTDLVDNLLNSKYIYRTQGRHGKLQPYTQYVPKYFVLKSGGTNSEGIEFLPSLRITPAGREFFYKKFFVPNQTELEV